MKSCSNCQSVSSNPPLAPVYPCEWSGKPWDRIHADYVGPFHGKYYLIVIDSFSKWLEVIQTDNTNLC